MTNDPQLSPEPESEPTIIIDEDALHEQLDNSGYSVRPRGEAEDEIVEVEAEEVLVVLPDDVDTDGLSEEGSGLLTHFPRPGEDRPKLVSPLEQAASPQRAEDVGLVGSVSEAGRGMAEPPAAVAAAPAGAYQPAPVPASMELPAVEDYGELPNFEAVEDITAFISSDGAALQAPGDDGVAPVRLAVASRRGGGGRWLSLAALAAIAVSGYLWGPQVYRDYVEPHLSGPVAQAAAGGSGLDPNGSANTDPDPEEATDPVETDPAPVSVDTIAFEAWLARSVADNLGLDPSAPRD